MAVVKVETIGTNAYAPKDASEINLYAFNGAYDLTLPQLVMAVCIRQAALIEKGCVMKMNEINASANWLSALALVGEQIMRKSSLDGEIDLAKTGYVPKSVSGGGTRITIRQFLTGELEVDAAGLPDNLVSVDSKAKAFEFLKSAMSQASISNQEQMIELQSYISRRDSTYNTSSSAVRKLGTAMNLTANNF